MNIGGLASGLDTNAISAGLMDVGRIPVNQLEARKAGHQAKDQAWQVTSARLSAIRTALDAVGDTASVRQSLDEAPRIRRAATAYSSAPQ